MIKFKREKIGVLEITLNRPEKRNALSIALMGQLCDAIEKAEKDASTRVIIINGEGPVFCAGLDLSEAQDPQKTDQSTQAIARMLKCLYHCPLVTIAAVQGSAYGGGAGLMAACDFVIADPKTLFGFPETRRGLVAAQIMAVLFRRVNPHALRELLIFGESIGSSVALEIGLINLISPKEIHTAESHRWADHAIKGAPQATRQTKQIIDACFARTFNEDIEEAVGLHHRVRQSEEAKEGIAAFMQKREPHWVLRGEK